MGRKVQELVKSEREKFGENVKSLNRFHLGIFTRIVCMSLRFLKKIDNTEIWKVIF